VSLTRLEGKSCGTCVACCEFVPIKADGLRKPSNTLCPHCVRDQGCTVYEVRPRECRGWYCGWFFMPGLPDEWHPSRSGIVIRPERFAENEITLLVLRKSTFLLSDTFAGMIGAWLEAGADISFELLGPPGHLPAKMRINEFLASAVAARDLREMHKLFAWVLSYIEQNHVWEPDGIVLHSELA
jgi:hypothetical protein